jgi:hypothetical protein
MNPARDAVPECLHAAQAVRDIEDTALRTIFSAVNNLLNLPTHFTALHLFFLRGQNVLRVCLCF